LCIWLRKPGVRHSLTHPEDYMDANLIGFFHVLQNAKDSEAEHFVYASSSSVYGANLEKPSSVGQSVDHPVSLYAATKKCNELIAHSYSHLFRLPTTGLRFFTVYGPLGPAGHGAVPVHQGHPRRQADRRVQPRQDGA
jgi:UDP-glucuronate 4-epimerase